MVSLGLLILRTILGGIFSLHGYTKVFGGPNKKVSESTAQVLGSGFAQSMEHGGIEQTTKMVENLGIPYPKVMGAGLAATELGGGLALIVGWHTRFAALALTISQIVAIAKVHSQHGLIAPGGYEKNAALIAGTAALAFAGGGKIAAD
jgi:putative oxidoreductase